MTTATAVHSCALGVVGEGPQPADVMFVGIAPGRDEALNTKRPFTGPSGKLLNGLLKLIDLDRTSIFVTNLCCFWNDKPSDEEIADCFPRFMDELKAVKPKVIVCLGKIVSETLLPDYTFGRMQGGAFWHEAFKCWILVMNHPAAFLHASQTTGFSADIAEGVRDIRKIPLYVNAPRDFGKVHYEVCQTLDECNTTLRHMASHYQTETDSGVVAIDVETYYPGSPNGVGMVSMSLTCAHGTWHIPKHLVYGPDYNLLLNGIDRPRWTFHNGMFDTNQIAKHLGTRLPIVEDTLLMSYSLDERGGGDNEEDSTGQDRSVGIHGLKGLAMEYCGAEFYNDVKKGESLVLDPITNKKRPAHPDELSPENLALYNSSDSEYTYRLQRYFEPLQIEDNVRKMYLSLLIPSANTLAAVHARGVYIDTDVLGQLAREWVPRWFAAETDLQESALQLGWDRTSINTNSPKQLSQFIYDICDAPIIGQGKLARSTSKPIVEAMVALHPEHVASQWLTKLLNWRGLDRDINTYIRGVETAKDASGFIHPAPALHGTRNGRLAYHDPPINTIPKARTVGVDRARIRRLFCAAPPSDLGTGERELLEADFRQAELWVASFVSGDQNMLTDLTTCTKCKRPTVHQTGLLVAETGPICDDGFLHKSDFHAKVVEENWHVTKESTDPVEWEYLRDSAKRIVYASSYGAGPDAIVQDKKLTGVGGSNYRFLATRAEAVKALNSFLGRYHVYKAWRDHEQYIVKTEGEQVSRTGRKRRYFGIQSYNQLNQAINTPVASFSHDFILAAMNELHPLLSEFDAFILFDVHDSLVFDIPKMYERECIELIVKIMTKPRWGSPCGIPVDLAIGKNWYDLHKKELDIDQITL